MVYDAVGRLTQLVDYDGQPTTFEYDQADRLTRRRHADGTEVRFTYTAGGRRATEEDARGVTSYQYDAAGRLARVDQPGTGAVQYAHDISNRLTSIATPGGTTTYGYDAMGRLATVQGSSGTTTYRYDPAGNLSAVLLPSGVTGALAHDARNRLTSVLYERAGATLSTFTYAYTPAGRRASVTEAGATTSFTYDQMGRLVDETRTGASAYSRQYEYDLAGNRTRLIANGLPVTYTYDADDRLLTAGSVAYTYDPRGNVASRDQAGAVSTFAWTPDNRLASVSSGAGVVSFQYDADGTRVAKATAAGTLRYLIDRRNPTGLRQVVEERDGAGGLVARHQFGAGLVSSQRNLVDSFVLPDGSGNVRQLTDTAGAVIDQYAYDAFGNGVAQAGSTENDYRYLGQQLDEETGLYYLRERYYDPAVGRFLGRDPVEGDPTLPTSLHRYAYAGNDPVNFADPNGDFFTLIDFSLTSVISGGIRGLEVGKQLSTICRVKGLAKAIPIAIGLRQAAESKVKFAEKLFELLSPSLSVGTLMDPKLSAALAAKHTIYEHPQAKLLSPPRKLYGDAKSVEIGLQASTDNELALELAIAEFPNSQLKFGGTCQIHPFQLKSWSFGIGKEKALFDIRVCDFISIGTIYGVVNATTSVTSGGDPSASMDLGLKLAVPFLPEVSFTVLKLPDDMR